MLIYSPPGPLPLSFLLPSGFLPASVLNYYYWPPTVSSPVSPGFPLSLFVLLFSLSLCLPSALSYPLFPVLGQCLKYETETCLFSIGQNTTFKLPWALQCQHPGQHSPFNYEICNGGKKDKRNLSHFPQLPYHGLWVYLSKLCFANLFTIS